MAFWGKQPTAYTLTVTKNEALLILDSIFFEIDSDEAYNLYQKIVRMLFEQGWYDWRETKEE